MRDLNIKPAERNDGRERLTSVLSTSQVRNDAGLVTTLVSSGNSSRFASPDPNNGLLNRYAKITSIWFVGHRIRLRMTANKSCVSIVGLEPPN